MRICVCGTIIDPMRYGMLLYKRHYTDTVVPYIEEHFICVDCQKRLDAELKKIKSAAELVGQ